ncbi:hypothetical protein LJB90_03665 [Eubacteriales bacterium OttesenSCG-928-G02]|nr:hypothetical protein [Eubacteriales bacterium OttesenSCG-928-G02]
MKNYNDFIKSISDNKEAVLYDAFSKMKDVSRDELILTSNDLELLTSAMLNINLSLLRLYHEWLHEELD